MSKICDWCKKESAKLITYEVLGNEYSICQDCMDAHEKDVCITCGEPLYGEMTLNGECSHCQQISAAKAEKSRSELLNGLGVDILAELTDSVVFTEEDYNHWVTFSQGNFTPENRATYRRKWISAKLCKELNWSEETLENNMSDIEYLLDNYSSKIFGKTCRFMLKDSRNKCSGLNIIAQRGNIMVIDI